MKWITANKEQKCTHCGTVVKPGEDYFGASYVVFCKPCGEKKEKGLLTYDTAHHRFVDASIGSAGKCYLCDDEAIGIILNKPVCEKHLADPLTTERPIGSLES